MFVHKHTDQVDFQASSRPDNYGVPHHPLLISLIILLGFFPADITGAALLIRINCTLSGGLSLNININC